MRNSSEDDLIDAKEELHELAAAVLEYRCALWTVERVRWYQLGAWIEARHNANRCLAEVEKRARAAIARLAP